MDQKDFSLKKEIDSITKLNPQERYTRIVTFLQKIKTEPKAKKDLDDWQMELGNNLVNFSGRVLEQVKINFKNFNLDPNVYYYFIYLL